MELMGFNMQHGRGQEMEIDIPAITKITIKGDINHDTMAGMSWSFASSSSIYFVVTESYDRGEYNRYVNDNVALSKFKKLYGYLIKRGQTFDLTDARIATARKDGRGRGVLVKADTAAARETLAADLKALDEVVAAEKITTSRSRQTLELDQTDEEIKRSEDAFAAEFSRRKRRSKKRKTKKRRSKKRRTSARKSRRRYITKSGKMKFIKAK